LHDKVVSDGSLTCLGAEFLVANPIHVPGLPDLIANAKTTSDTNPYVPLLAQAVTVALNGAARALSTDSFARLPQELKHMIMEYLPSKDIANLSSASRNCEIPRSLFRRFVLEDLPWFWEASDLPRGQTDWFRLYSSLKSSSFKGLRNRKRIWKDVLYIIEQIEPFRHNAHP